LNDDGINVGYVLNHRIFCEKKIRQRLAWFLSFYFKRNKTETLIKPDVEGRLKRSDDLLLESRWKYWKFCNL